MNSTAAINWAAMPHSELQQNLAAGLAEARQRVEDMLALTGAPLGAPEERRGPGRPPGATNKPKLSAREQQLADAAAEQVQ